METLERSRVCRLCGKHAGITIDIFDKRGNHVKKINSVLPILVHEMDLLPKHICHPCNYKLQEFHKFYEECLKTDANLKGQLSWMRGSMERKETGVPMVQINNFMIKTEPPDYNDEDTTTEVIMRSGNLTNYVQNNCNSYPEDIFTSSAVKCSRCGCYCGNRNRVELQIGKNDGKTRTSRHTNETKNNGDLTSRDTIRRNLFATEIFGDKNPRIQTEIPICNIPQGIITDVNGTEVLNADVKLQKLAARQNGDRIVTRHKMAADTNKMATRTLRPRKKRATHSSNVVSAPEVNKKSRNEEFNVPESNTFKPLEIKEIKVENCEEIRRSLRPRMEAIDYSDSKRKNPMARSNDTKRSKSAECQSNTKVQRNIHENLTTYDRNTNFSISNVSIKVEPEVLTATSGCLQEEQNSMRSKFVIPAKSVKSKNSKIVDEFNAKSIKERITSKRNVERTKSEHFSRGRVMNVSRRGNLPEYSGIPAVPYLRSQRGHLRNGKMMEFDSSANKPKKIQSIKGSHGILLQSIKRENGRTSQIIFKHRDCEFCKNRFASAELYMLHDCYANKRH